ncbi:LysR family transcriptional regulator [soil metagenome]
MADLTESLTTFVRVAERNSFSAVATELVASHTTIARRIDFLEQHYGARLFKRSTRALKLTEEGERMLDHARSILQEIALTEADFGERRTTPEGLVRVGVTTALGMFLTKNLLGQFYTLYPRLRIEFLMSDWHGNMVQEGLDAAFRIGDIAEDSLIQRRLCEIPRFLVASPSYIASQYAPEATSDLTSHNLLAYGYDRDPVIWNIDEITVPAEGRFKCNSSAAVHQAALAGLGIGLLPEFQVADDLKSGHLLPVLPDAKILPLRLSIAYPPDRRLPPRTRIFVDFVKSAVEPLIRRGAVA